MQTTKQKLDYVLVRKDHNSMVWYYNFNLLTQVLCALVSIWLVIGKFAMIMRGIAVKTI